MGADINIKDKAGVSMTVSFEPQWLCISALPSKLYHFLNQRTPLHVAASKGHDYTVECLVKIGANINIKDKAGVSMTLLLNYGG